MAVVKHVCHPRIVVSLNLMSVPKIGGKSGTGFIMRSENRIWFITRNMGFKKKKVAVLKI